MHVTTSGGIQLYYETFGQRGDAPLLLIHGLGADHQMWRPQLSSFPAAGYFVIAPDMRDHGKSSRAEIFRLKDCARDMQELLDLLQVERASIVGVSMGGLIAQQMAFDFPEVVKSLVVVDSFSGVCTQKERYNAWLASALLKVMPAKMIGNLISSTYKRMGHAEVASYFESQMAQSDVGAIKEVRAAVNAFNILERLTEIRAPTLVLVGDAFGKMAIQMAKRTAEGIPGAQFKVLPGGGDPSNLLVPDAFDQAVLEFLT
jgi:3-oxoadipate enol-lactonase